MNFISIIEKGFKGPYSSNETTIKMVAALTDMYRQVSDRNRADIQLFETKSLKFPDNGKMKHKWYSEHISGTAEHCISILFYECLHTLKHYSYLYEKYKTQFIFDMTFETFLSKRVLDICNFTKQGYNIQFTNKDFVSSLEAIFIGTNGSLYEPAIKLLGFLCIVCGSLDIDPVPLYFYYIEHETL